MTHTTETHSIAIPAKERMTPRTESADLVDRSRPIDDQGRTPCRHAPQGQTKEMAAQSIWDSEGGAGERWTTDGNKLDVVALKGASTQLVADAAYGLRPS